MMNRCAAFQALDIRHFLPTFRPVSCHQLTMFPPADVKETVQKIADLLVERGETIAVSESACGGLISAYLVSVPGASRYYHGGTLTYSLKSRLKLSGWEQQDIDSYTGPSEAVATRLARNLKIELASTYTLSETGWAGPTSMGQPVGTFYVGIAGPKGEVSVVRDTGCQDREANMQQFAREALEFFLEYLQRD
uniref:ARAD1B12672p n=1 Tax=Blastobotrys adeninivorans TaxID=409370 RepID=A0A060T627_BLAAD